MLRAFGPGLPSDAISHRYGFDGFEQEEMLSYFHRYHRMGVHSTFSINTRYEEIGGGYYVNRSLFVLIDQAIRNIGIYPVLWDTTLRLELVPVEGVGHLCEGEDYRLLLSDQREIGTLKIYEFNIGGGSPFYKDSVVFDFILPADLTEQLVGEVETKSRECGVAFTRVPEISSKPILKYGWWYCIWRSWAKGKDMEFYADPG